MNLRLQTLITKNLSIRISMMVVCAAALLLTAALFVMFRYSRKAVKKETLQKAEQTLEATVQQVDNILLSVEQSTGNLYWNLINHLDDPDRMFVYSRKAVETNPYIVGCAIAFEPYYYQAHGHGKYFMAYVHRAGSDDLTTVNTPIIQASTFGNVPYTEQVWYTTPKKIGRPCWVNPLKNAEAEDEAITTFCLPIYDRSGHVIGVLAADVSLNLLSKVVLAAKPSPNSYAALLGSDGSYIVHPDTNTLYHHTIYTKLSKDSEARRVGEDMLAGKSGYARVPINGVDCYVFYKPFTRADVPGRSMEQLNWSAGIVYPEDDIFGEYNGLLYTVLAIAGVGLLLLLILSRTILHRLLLPLRMLTQSARRIADGHFDEVIPDSRQHDEVGRLQDHFQQMQQALAVNMGELNRLTESLQQRGEVLAAAYRRARQADRMKTAFLHHMTNQMTPPVTAISHRVQTLCEHYADIDPQEMDQMVADILEQGKTITKLLDDLLKASQDDLNEVTPEESTT